MVIWKDLSQNYQIRFISNIFHLFSPFFFSRMSYMRIIESKVENKLLNLKDLSSRKIKYCMFKIDIFLQDHVSFPN